eukprot:1159708-Pelagomonas_calceolata.AAC.8
MRWVWHRCPTILYMANAPIGMAHDRMGIHVAKLVTLLNRHRHGDASVAPGIQAVTCLFVAAAS